MVKVLLTGGSGTLGTEILKIYDKEKYKFLSPSSSKLDITNYISCQAWFLENKPDLVIHSAAYTNVKESEQNYIKSINTNIIGTCNMVRCCDELGIKLVYISTDYVFDGAKGNYSIEDAINPLTKYAKSKAAGELAVRMYPKSLVIRTSFFGYTFPYEKAFIDQWSSKDYVDLMAPKILEECLSERLGVSHVGSKRRSLYEIAVERKPEVAKASLKDSILSIPRDTSFWG